MAKIISISIPRDDEYVAAEMESLGGSVSGHWVEAAKMYLGEKGKNAPPYWYIEGKDYSHLPIEIRQELVKFGYADKEVG